MEQGDTLKLLAKGVAAVSRLQVLIWFLLPLFGLLALLTFAGWVSGAAAAILFVALAALVLIIAVFVARQRATS